MAEGGEGAVVELNGAGDGGAAPLPQDYLKEQDKARAIRVDQHEMLAASRAKGYGLQFRRKRTCSEYNLYPFGFASLVFVPKGSSLFDLK